jgi:DNA-binding MarR family transcriptional regulator
MSTGVRRPRACSAANEAWGLLSPLIADQRRRFLAIAGELDLHPAQTGVLAHMEPGIGVPMHDLATLLGCDNSNVTGIVDRLEARGLVERRPHEHDRRIRHVLLTPAGISAHERIRDGMSQAPEALRRLSAADQRALRDILRRALTED